MSGLDLDRFAHIDADDPDAEPRRWARRTIAGAVATAAVLLLATTGHEPTDNGRHATPVNTSTDGRYHTCGLVTEDGVTDHLAEYAARCTRR